jgi:hypothetical protein
MKQEPIVVGKLILFFVLFLKKFVLILLPPTPTLILEFEDMFNTLMTTSTN